MEENNNIFNENPFIILSTTPKFIFPKDTFLQQIHDYLNNLSTSFTKQKTIGKDERLLLFLAANAYYNMGLEGNISMMRRFTSWSDFYLSDFEDEAEFRQSNLAKSIIY
ncbi:MAG: hypothetical protein IPJ43_20655 [Saprospiraceae bacterium]|nr:hypothetical protein [Saprospiraceae bacterium]